MKRSVMCLAWSMVLLVLASAAYGSDQGQVAYWNFDEGKGNALQDLSGHDNHGEIRGATWVKSGAGYALSFDGVDDYVDCGNGPSLDITGPITLQAWVKPTAANQGEPGIVGKFFESYAFTYYSTAHFYISSGGNNVQGPLKVNVWTHIAASFDGQTMRIYLNGEEWGTKKSKFTTVNHGKNFLMGCIVGNPTSADRSLRGTAFFPGLIDGVRVHNRVLEHEEVVKYYNLEATSKGQTPFDTDKFGRFKLEPFFYPDEDRAVLSVNFRWMLPLSEGTRMYGELVAVDSQESVRTWEIHPNSARYESEGEFSLKGLEPGTYEFCAVLHDGENALKTESVQFQYPLEPRPDLPSPDVKQIATLAPAIGPPSYDVKVTRGGGLNVTVKGRTYKIESSYSYPHGGDNRLVAGFVDRQGENAWSVRVKERDGKPGEVTARGKYYEISRRITLEESRIMVRDTITNKSDDVIGIILSNHINLRDLEDAQVTDMTNPTIFVGTHDSGVGILPMDDLYHLRTTNRATSGLAEVRDENFGLDEGASYTIEWAIYPTATNDYYTFINQIRKDEDLHGYVAGTMNGMSRTKPLPAEVVDRKNVTYARIGTLGEPPDDRTVSLEGFEFMEYPIESANITKTFAQSKELYPDMLVMFHVAHTLYACGDPEERFPDSRALYSDGRQMHYGPNTMAYYGNYFSKQRVDDGWRWWIFYPTMENSFGKAMIEAMEYMVDEMGATAMWADGFISGYVRSGYSYDRWDGHSVDIDPETKLVTARKNCVPWVSLPVLRKSVRILAAKGGVMFTNGHPGPPSLWKEAMITSCETGGGDKRPLGQLHLGRTLVPLGNPSAIKNGRDVYRDAISKLDFGALYQWFGDGERLKYKTIVEHMYPITFESIHPGTVRGRERIITRKSGVYGWLDDRALHAVYFYDARGALARHDFVTTVSTAGVRTEVMLGKDESAAIVRLPVTLTSDNPVNVSVRGYDEQAIELALHGQGAVLIEAVDGQFPSRTVNLDGQTLITVPRTK
jgi:hypothetical protein